MKMQIITMKNGQKEVNKKKKPSIIQMALFLALLDQPNYSGFNWNQYIEATIQYNTQQLYKQVILNIIVLLIIVCLYNVVNKTIQLKIFIQIFSLR